MNYSIGSIQRIIVGISVIALFGVLPSIASAATLSRQLEIGMSGDDVAILQTYLAEDTTIYPRGLVTGYFGELTQSAVTAFQARNGIDTVGRVGPITMAAINTLIVNKVYTITTTTTSGGDISAPTIHSPNVNSTASGTYVTWNTSEPTKGTVYYSTAPLTEYELPHSVTISGSVAMTDVALRTTHNVMITGLQPNTTYYYDIYSTDATGNASMTMQNTFRTTN